jgi:hypothetical protein
MRCLSSVMFTYIGHNLQHDNRRSAVAKADAPSPHHFGRDSRFFVRESESECRVIFECAAQCRGKNQRDEVECGAKVKTGIAVLISVGLLTLASGQESGTIREKYFETKYTNRFYRQQRYREAVPRPRRGSERHRRSFASSAHSFTIGSHCGPG